DKYASNVMSAGLGIDDAVYLNATGELYRHYGRGDTAWESYGHRIEGDLTYWTNPNRTGRLAMVRAEPTADDAQAGRPNNEFCYLTAEGALSQYEFGPMGILLHSMDTVGR